ncbi:MAG: cobyric acid synthase [Leptospirillia bacterium]
MAAALMLCGTGSHVGKSLLTAAFCRLFARQGLRVAPFKSQNMSNNAAVCDGGEIGRAQALQARAAGLSPHVDMNPILLKPVGEARSQVVVHGQVWDTLDVTDYHRFKETDGRRIAGESYRRLSENADLVVIEGAGSPAEINLKDHDIANLWVADMADARVLLVGDIDRGGVFAAFAGTLELLNPAERARIAGFLINKFRGRADLLIPAIDYLRERYGKPTFGVIPMLEHTLPEEDGLGVADRGGGFGAERLNIAVIHLPRIANFTDFDPFTVEPDVSLGFVDRPEQLAGADMIILPGSKAVIPDLAWLKARGLDVAIREHAGKGGAVAGICGGYQMLGRHISDPHGVEQGGEAQGLGLLDCDTVMAEDKRCERVFLRPATASGLGTMPLEGYEIHMGRTRIAGGTPLFADAPEGTGVRVGNVWGSYLHGLFESDAARRALLAPLRDHKGLAEPEAVVFADLVERSLDSLADTVAKYVDMDAVRGLL